MITIPRPLVESTLKTFCISTLTWFGFYVVFSAIKRFGETVVNIDAVTLMILIGAMVALLGGLLFFHRLARGNSRKEWMIYIGVLFVVGACSGILTDFFSGTVILAIFSLPGLLLLTFPQNIQKWGTQFLENNVLEDLRGPTIIHVSVVGFFVLWMAASFTNVYSNWIFLTGSMILSIFGGVWIVWCSQSLTWKPVVIDNGERVPEARQESVKSGEESPLLSVNTGWYAILVLILAAWHHSGLLSTYTGMFPPLAGAWVLLLSLILGVIMVVVIHIRLQKQSRAFLVVALLSLLLFILVSSVELLIFPNGDLGALWCRAIGLFCLPLAIGGIFLPNRSSQERQKRKSGRVFFLSGECVVVILLLITMTQINDTLILALQWMAVVILSTTYVLELRLVGRLTGASPQQNIRKEDSN